MISLTTLTKCHNVHLLDSNSNLFPWPSVSPLITQNVFVWTSVPSAVQLIIFLHHMCLFLNAILTSIYSTQGERGPDGPAGEKGVIGMKVKQFYITVSLFSQFFINTISCCIWLFWYWSSLVAYFLDLETFSLVIVSKFILMCLCHTLTSKSISGCAWYSYMK